MKSKVIPTGKVSEFNLQSQEWDPTYKRVLACLPRNFLQKPIQRIGLEKRN